MWRPTCPLDPRSGRGVHGPRFRRSVLKRRVLAGRGPHPTSIRVRGDSLKFPRVSQCSRRKSPAACRFCAASRVRCSINGGAVEAAPRRGQTAKRGVAPRSTEGVCLMKVDSSSREPAILTPSDGAGAPGSSASDAIKRQRPRTPHPYRHAERPGVPLLLTVPEAAGMLRRDPGRTPRASAPRPSGRGRREHHRAARSGHRRPEDRREHLARAHRQSDLSPAVALGRAALR